MKKILLAVQIIACLVGAAFIALAFGKGESAGGRLLSVALASLCFGVGLAPILLKRKTAPAAPQKVPESGLLRVTVRGAEYYQSQIERHMVQNPDWLKDISQLKSEGKQYKIIYQYELTAAAAELVPEPTNPHDKNAIMVTVGGDKIGYVAAEECADILPLIRGGRIDRADVTLRGGPAKREYEDGRQAREAVNFGVSLQLRIK